VSSPAAASKFANYGWSSSERMIVTKVYGHGVLTTWALDDNIVRHKFETFAEHEDRFWRWVFKL
jgi:hypothetical protein